MTDLPIACSLDGSQLRARREVWRRLVDDALRDQRVTATGVQLAYAAAADVEQGSTELVQLERD
jgi:hypothetical protein